MGAPSLDFKQIIDKLRRGIDGAALAHSIQFYIPTLATALASFGLFGLLAGVTQDQLNSTAAVIMISVIVSLLASAPFQFVVYRMVDEAEVSGTDTRDEGSLGRTVVLCVLLGSVLAALLSLSLYPYIRASLSLSEMQFLACCILTVLYSATWVLLSSVWATGHHRQPAITFVIAYAAVFLLGYNLAAVGVEYIIWGYIGGILILFISLSLASWRLLEGQHQDGAWRRAFGALLRMSLRSAWGMVFQTLFVIALFLDKIVVWTREGASSGAVLWVVGPYTTGSFLGFIPTLSLMASAYYTERLKTASKGMYTGTLSEIKARTLQYKRLYLSGISSTMFIGLVLLLAVVLLTAHYVGDPEIVTIAATVGSGVLLFQGIVSNSAMLSVFGRTYVSAASMFMVCLGEAASIFFLGYSVWYAALGFFAGSLVGLLISHSATVRLISSFEYNAFRSFQTVS